MNIIWLTPEIPFPPIGGRNGVYNRIVQVGAEHNIFLFSITYNEEEELEGRHEMEKHCRQVSFYNRSRHKVRTILESLVLPHCVASRDNTAMKQDLLRCATENEIDMIVMDFPHMLPNLLPLHKQFQNIPITVQQHNVEFLTMRSLAGIQGMSYIKKFVYYAESVRLELYERRIYKSGVISSYSFFSEQDEAYFKQHIAFQGKRTEVIPLGANDNAGKINETATRKHTIIFVGKMSGIANVEAVLWFAKKVFPLIQKKIKDAVFQIVGADPLPQVLALESKDIVVTGGFDTPDAYYEAAAAVVIPVFSGGGVKGKLLEAISYKRPVITTRHGICGTKLKAGEHVLTSDDAAVFAKHCVNVLTHPQDYKKMVDSAYIFFQNHYSWARIGSQYSKFLLEETEYEDNAI